MEWSDLQTILEIGRSKSLSGAARNLGVNHSTIFRKLKAIEAQAKVRFFDRVANTYIPTEAGEAIIEVAGNIEEEILDVQRQIMAQDLKLKGKIYLSAPEGISVNILTPLLIRFCKAHPEIEILMNPTSQFAEIGRREADVVVRVTSRPPDASFGKRICGFRFAFYAALAYLKQAKNKASEEHRWLVDQDSMDWKSVVFGKKTPPELDIPLQSKNMFVIINALKAGLGIALLPCFVGDSEKSLVRVSELPEPPRRELWVLSHTDLRHTARVRALMNFLYKGLSEQSRLFEGDEV